MTHLAQKHLKANVPFRSRKELYRVRERVNGTTSYKALWSTNSRRNISHSAERRLLIQQYFGKRRLSYKPIKLVIMICRTSSDQSV